MIRAGRDKPHLCMDASPEDYGFMCVHAHHTHIEGTPQQIISWAEAVIDIAMSELPKEAA